MSNGGDEMNIYVLDDNFNIIHIVDEYKSLIWETSFFEMGEFELYASASAGLLEKIKKTNYLVREQDIQENKTFKNVMIVDNIELTTNTEDGNFLVITGYCLKSILKRRIIWGQFVYNDTPKDTINAIINYNIINPTIEDRKISNFMIGSEDVATYQKAKFQYTGNCVYDVITSICKLYKYGFDIYIENGNFVFTLFEGTNRTLDQQENTPILFSPDFDNISNSSYENKNMGNYCNVALVAGEGEGINRKSKTVSSSPGIKGLQRRELFVDARDLSSNEGQIDDEKYVNMLKKRGEAKLQESAISKAYECNAINGIQHTFNIDYYLGDIVEVMNEYGISIQPRVTSVIEAEDENGKTIVPSFKVDEVVKDNDDDTSEDEASPECPKVTLQDGVVIYCESFTFAEVFDYLEETYPNKNIFLFCEDVHVFRNTPINEDKNCKYYYKGMEYLGDDGDDETNINDQFTFSELTSNSDTFDSGVDDYDWTFSNSSGMSSSSPNPGSIGSGLGGGGSVNDVSIKIVSGEVIRSGYNTIDGLNLPSSIKKEQLLVYLNGSLIKREEFDLVTNDIIKFNFPTSPKTLSVGTYYQIHYLSVD